MEGYFHCIKTKQKSSCPHIFRIKENTMAQRRLFSTKVTCSDSFLSLSYQSQALYYQLGLMADDDGFTGSAETVLRTLKMKKPRLKELEEAGFIITFPSGVVAITHWHINNSIPKSRYVPTVFAAESKMIYVNNCGIYERLNSDSSELSRDCAVMSAAQNDFSVCGKCENNDEYSEQFAAQEKIREDKTTQVNTKQVNESKESLTYLNSSESITDEEDKHTLFYLGRYANVLLSYDEIEALKKDIEDYEAYIEKLSEYIEQSGKKYQSHDAVIRRWYRADREKKQGEPQNRERKMLVPEIAEKPSYDLDAYTARAMTGKIQYKSSRNSETS